MIAAPALGLLLCLGAPPQASSEASKTRRYSLIIGVNKPAKADQSPLRFADDDAARFYDIFRELPGAAALFSLLDDATQVAFPETAQDAELPKKAAIFARAEQMFARMRSDHAQGVRTEFYLIYSGHGYVDDTGMGHLGLLDGTLRRTELYEKLLSRSPARINHVVIDACDAYFFVQSRGEKDIEALLSRRAHEYLDRQTLKRYPNTGAILSTASAAKSHEWSQIQGGVFSHSVRSALLGAADADGDRKISYDEIESFVLAASAGVKHVGAQRAVFVTPPSQDRLHPVLPLRALRRAQTLRLEESAFGRFALLDEAGRRYADLNKATGHALSLSLLPGRQYYVRHKDAEYLVPRGAQGPVHFGTLEPGEVKLASRGGIAQAYGKGLFSIPYGPQVLSGFRLRANQGAQLEIVPKRSPALRIVGYSLGAGALVSGGVALATGLLGASAHRRYQDAQEISELVRLDRQVRDLGTARNVAIGVGASLALTAGVLFLIDLLEASP